MSSITTQNETKYWMSNCIIYTYSGSEYQFSLFTSLALKYLKRNENQASKAQFEISGKENLDDFAFIFPNVVKAYQVKHYKGVLEWNEFQGEGNPKMHFGKLYKGWCTWNVTYPSHTVIPIIFTNAGLQPKMLGNMVRANPGKRKITFCLEEQCVQDTTIHQFIRAFTHEHSTYTITEFLRSLRFKINRQKLVDLEGSNLDHSNKGEIETQLENIYSVHESKAKLLSIYIQWSVKKWFKDIDTDSFQNVPGSRRKSEKRALQSDMNAQILDKYVNDFDSLSIRDDAGLRLLVQAKERVFENIDTSINGQEYVTEQELDHLGRLVNLNKITLITGKKGAGKSALVKLFVSRLPCCVLAFAAEEMNGCRNLNEFFKTRLLIDPVDPYKQVKNTDACPKILYIDAIEKLDSTESKGVLRELLNFYGDYSVLLTCTSNSDPHIAELFSQQQSEVYELGDLSSRPAFRYILEEENSSWWKENLPLFFQTPFMLKMLFLAIEDIDKEAIQNSSSSEAVVLRIIRRHIWKNWICKGSETVQFQLRQFLMFDLVTKNSKMVRRTLPKIPTLKELDNPKMAFSPLERIIFTHQHLILEMREEGILNNANRPAHDILEKWAFLSLFDAIFENTDKFFFLKYLKDKYIENEKLDPVFNSWLSEVHKISEEEYKLESFYSFLRAASLDSKTTARILFWGISEQKLDLDRLLSLNLDPLCKKLSFDPEYFIKTLDTLHRLLVRAHVSSIEPLLTQVDFRSHSLTISFIFCWLVATDQLSIQQRLKMIGQVELVMSNVHSNKYVSQFFQKWDGILPFALKKYRNEYEDYQDIPGEFRNWERLENATVSSRSIIVFLIERGYAPTQEIYEDFLIFYSTFSQEIHNSLEKSSFDQDIYEDWLGFVEYASHLVQYKWKESERLAVNASKLKEILIKKEGN